MLVTPISPIHCRVLLWLRFQLVNREVVIVVRKDALVHYIRPVLRQIPSVSHNERTIRCLLPD